MREKVDKHEPLSDGVRNWTICKGGHKGNCADLVPCAKVRIEPCQDPTNAKHQIMNTFISFKQICDWKWDSVEELSNESMHDLKTFEHILKDFATFGTNRQTCTTIRPKQKLFILKERIQRKLSMFWVVCKSEVSNMHGSSQQKWALWHPFLMHPCR